jgi:hypothetical protein
LKANALSESNDQDWVFKSSKMVSVIGMRTHPWRGANSLDLTSGLGRIYVESSDRQHSGTQGSGTHVLRRVSKSVPTIAGICVGDRVRFPCTKQLGRGQEVSTKVFERHKEDEMAIPKYADPDRGPYQVVNNKLTTTRYI